MILALTAPSPTEIIMAITSVGALAVAVIAVSRKQDVRLEQPLQVERIENMATRREVEEVKDRVGKIEDSLTGIREDFHQANEKQIALGEKRSTVLHNRINPLVENTAAIKGSNEALLAAFNNFTEVLKSLVTTKEGK